jgi:hypothetical protein
MVDLLLLIRSFFKFVCHPHKWLQTWKVLKKMQLLHSHFSLQCLRSFSIHLSNYERHSNKLKLNGQSRLLSCILILCPKFSFVHQFQRMCIGRDSLGSLKSKFREEEKEVSISTTFYARLFRKKVLREAFFVLRLKICTFFGAKKSAQKLHVICWWNWLKDDTGQ